MIYKIFIGLWLILCVISLFCLGMVTDYLNDGILPKKENTIKFALIYQFAITSYLSKYINLAGIIILEILVTLLVWPINLTIAAILLFCLILKMIGKLFVLVFGKKQKCKCVYTENSIECICDNCQHCYKVKYPDSNYGIRMCNYDYIDNRTCEHYRKRN